MHQHYDQWEMYVNVNYYYVHGYIYNTNAEYNAPPVYSVTVDTVRERTGQHELGHVLGLKDVDTLCSSANLQDHHEEILMGYGNGARSTYAKYKDIAGVSITRGFHTDADHVWMLRTNDNGTQDVICAQCNGVRKNISLVDGKYEGKSVNTYKSCVHHGGSNEEMLLVATDGIRNFFKCQYCRHIETLNISDYISVPTCSMVNINKVMTVYEKYYRLDVDRNGVYKLETNEAQNFTFSICDDNLNSMGCILNGNTIGGNLSVYLSEGTYYLKIRNNNTNTNGGVATANYNFRIGTVSNPHSYTDWKRLSSTHHIECCEYCGQTGTETGLHTIIKSEITLNIAHCIHCGAKIMLGDDIVQVPGMLNVQKVSINGSYILPNGIIVLVDEDIEAYENGTLVFYDRDDLPMIQ